MNPYFVRSAGLTFSLGQKPYCLTGANCYYLSFGSDAMVRDVFSLAALMRLNVLRTWAFFGRGSPGGVCFQYQDPLTRDICLNAGPSGLERLDRTIALAEENDVRLILPLINYWDDFGGITQYCEWFGLSSKPEFFTNPQTRQAYRNYAEHILLRTNTRTGRQYRDETAIFAWELANEPRCEAPNGTDILCEWVDEMGSFLKSIDPNHLVGVGDEGYFRRARAGNNPLYNGAYGVDCERLLNFPAIDFGTCHLYPTYADLENTGAHPIEFGRRWIQEHIEAGQRAGKPMIVEEYGWKSDDARGARDDAFRAWLDQVDRSQGAGSLLWMIAGKQDSGEPYPDYDGYTVYAPRVASA